MEDVCVCMSIVILLGVSEGTVFMNGEGGG